jgi:hypothetical protein
MDFLSRDQILTAQDIPFRDVPVPEWSTDPNNPAFVRIAGLDAKEASSFSSKLVAMDGKGNIKEVKMDNFLTELLQRTLVDENFKPLFSNKDIEALGKKSAAVMKRLTKIAMELSGLDEDSKKEAEKNSEVPSDALPTD